VQKVTGHSRAGDPSPPKEMASHVNEHKNIKTAFMFVQPFAHSYISHAFRGIHIVPWEVHILDLTFVKNITSVKSDGKNIGECNEKNQNFPGYTFSTDSITYGV